MKRKDAVKKATIKMLNKRDRNKDKQIELSKFDNPEKYFKAVQNSEQEALAKIANMRFK